MKTKKVDSIELRKYHFASEITWPSLAESDREWFLKSSTKKQLAKKVQLFEQESEPLAVYVLLKGRVKAIQSNADGSSQILLFYCEGDIFGYRPLLAGESQPVSIVALEPSEFLVVPKSRFLELLKQSATLSEQLLVSLSREFSVLVNRINSFTQRDTRQRLALALLLLHLKFGHDAKGDKTGPITLSRSDLADYVGTTLETLVRLLTELKSRGVLRIEVKNIFIIDKHELIRLANLS